MTTTDTTTPSDGEIVARADRGYRIKQFIMALVLIGYGGWSIYDGFVSWPAHNRRFDEIDGLIKTTQNAEEVAKLKEEQKQIGSKHSDTDVMLNKVLGIALPPLGAFVLVRALRKSRGEIRLSGHTLHVPGHPPVPFESITAVDQRLWDKKGIAYISYGLSEGRNGRILLDDYIYQRKPVDAIYDRIVAYVSPPDTKSTEAGSTPQEPSPSA